MDILLKIAAHCDRWSEHMAALKTHDQQIECIRHKLPELLKEKEIFIQILKNIVVGKPYPDIRKPELFDHEIVLHTCPKFSLRLYFHLSGEYTKIHDHNSWGVSGTPFGELGVIKYERQDNGQIEGYAQLKETKRKILTAGNVDVTLPLDQGIHQTGSPNHQPVIMISVYGRPARRLFIQEFDAQTDQVYKLYPLKLWRKTLAAQALNAVEQNIFPQNQVKK